MRIFVTLWALWLVFNETLAFGHVVLGAAIAAACTWAYSRLRGPEATGARKPLTALRLLFAVIADVVRSNFAVGGIVLGLGPRSRAAGFLPIPLALRHPGGLAVLACIVTATPGTSWIQYDEAAGVLTLHVLDLASQEDMVRTFKHRYEQPLMEIFE
jgi:multicomponent K+:H+ antiporter subunit E